MTARARFARTVAKVRAYRPTPAGLATGAGYGFAAEAGAAFPIAVILRLTGPTWAWVLACAAFAFGLLAAVRLTSWANGWHAGRESAQPRPIPDPRRPT